MSQLTIDDFLFNCNAYFYTLGDSVIDERDIDEMFDNILKGVEVISKSLHKEVRVNSNRVQEVRYSYLFFKKHDKPSCIKSMTSDWLEVKIGYFVFIEIGRYIVILKKNTKAFRKMRAKLHPIDYEKLLTLYVDAKSKFEKFSMRNLDASDYALRSRILEANDLQSNVSALSCGSFYLQSLRVKDSNTTQKYSVNASESRINTFNTAQPLEEICIWASKQVQLIEAAKERRTFLNIFAQPVSYFKVQKELVPNSVLVSLSLITDLLEADDTIWNRGSDIVQSNEIVKLCDELSVCFELTRNDDKHYISKNSIVTIHKTAYKIELESEKLSAISVKTKDGSINCSILDLLNDNCGFIVTFRQSEYVYSHGKLFKDTRLKSSALRLLANIHKIPALDNTFCEKTHKRDFKGLEDWDEDSIFWTVEHDSELGRRYKHLICDDCKDEWADHIGISDKGVSFFVSKHKDSKYSASAFHDVVSQALKNLGNMTPSEEQLNTKAKEWVKTHTEENNIHRYRCSDDNIEANVKSAVEIWKNKRLYPNFKRRMCLVVDFLSFESISKILKGFECNTTVPYVKSSFQILWLLSSFVSSCLEMGIEPFIYCRGSKDKKSDEDWKKSIPSDSGIAY